MNVTGKKGTFQVYIFIFFCSFQELKDAADNSKTQIKSALAATQDSVDGAL